MKLGEQEEAILNREEGRVWEIKTEGEVCTFGVMCGGVKLKVQCVHAIQGMHFESMLHNERAAENYHSWDPTRGLFSALT